MKKPDSRGRILGFSDSRSVFTNPAGTPHFFKLMRDMSPQERPVIYYIGAARNDDSKRKKDFIELAKRFKCEPRLFDFYNMKSGDPEAYFPDADIIYIDGGVTRNLLALVREWKADRALVKAYESGVLLAGASAGISVFFEHYVTDSIKTHIESSQGLGVLKGSVCAHYDINPVRQKVLESNLKSEAISYPAYGLPEGTAILFQNGKVEEVYSCEPDKFITLFRQRGDQIRCAPTVDYSNHYVDG